MILLDDCLNAIPKLNNIDLTVTSPPYFNAREYSNWDSYQDYLNFMEEVINQLFNVTTPGRFLCINSSPVIEARESRQHESKRRPIPFHLFNLCEKVGWMFIDEIIWLKPEGAAKNRNGGFYQHRKPCAYKPNVVTENILIFRKPDGNLIDKIVRSYSGDRLQQSLVTGDYERSNVWSINPETKSKHSAPFPLELPEKLIRYYSFVDDLVLDPFMGSGSTGIACINTDRQFIGIEKDPNYFNLATKRIHGTTRQSSL